MNAEKEVMLTAVVDFDLDRNVPGDLTPERCLIGVDGCSTSISLTDISQKGEFTMRTKRFLMIFIAATFLISFVAMNAGAEKVLKVGLMGPFTGPAAESGQNIKNSINTLPGILLLQLSQAGH